MQRPFGNYFRLFFVDLFTICKNLFLTVEYNELKKKTGIIIDEYGNKIDDSLDLSPLSNNLNEITNQQPKQLITNAKKYTPITSYKPSGNLIYNDSLINKLENKFT